MTKKWNIALLGYGKMGRLRETVLMNFPNVQINKIYDPDLHDDDRAVAELDDIFNDLTIDAVIIGSPNKYNKPFTIRALEAGKHVFCEKPPAFTAEDVREIMEVERKSGKKLMYGFNHRYHGSMIKIKELIDSGEYGKVLWMRGRYGKSVDKNLLENWRMSKAESGGGILLDQGIHMLDLMLHFAGGFDVFQAIISNLYWKMDIEDNVFVNMLNSENGIAASLHSTMTQWRHLFSLEIFLEKGHFVVNGLKTSSNSYGKEVLTVETNLSQPPEVKWGPSISYEYPTDESWNLEMEHFISSIENDLSIKNGSSEDALQVMEAIDEIYKSKRG